MSVDDDVLTWRLPPPITPPEWVNGVLAPPEPPQPRNRAERRAAAKRSRHADR